MNRIESVIQSQKEYYNTHITRDMAFRLKQLERLKISIQRHEGEILDALEKDLGKHPTESYMTEVGIIITSINHMIRKVKGWLKPKRVNTPVFLWPAKSKVIHDPYGTVLIIGPFNYPFQLVMEPLIGALAAGNTAVVKPSEQTPNVADVIEKVIVNAFQSQYVHTFLGGVETNQALLKSDVDYIFFTGSSKVGKIVAETAGKTLTPYTLELGGKSPAIVNSSANIKLAAKRIIWGKTINAGQTCIAPDYVLVQEDVKDELIKEMKKAINQYYGIDIENNQDYGKIVNTNHFDRLNELLESDREKIVYGGLSNREERFIEPTLVELRGNEYRDSKLMKEEIFGPILPIIKFKELDEAIELTKTHPNPLALYVFTEEDYEKEMLLAAIPSGGVSINDTILHVANPNLPFGGVRDSGIGRYKGKYSVDTFTHTRGVYEKSTCIDFDFNRPPYGQGELKLLKKIFDWL